MIETPTRAPADWSAELDRSEADVVAGRTVPATEARAKLRATIAELEAKLPSDRQHKASRHR